MSTNQTPRFSELLEKRLMELKRAIHEEDRVLVLKEYAWLNEVVDRAIDRIQLPRQDAV